MPISNPDKKTRRGFTLIEILIVISIIAILAATIVPNFIGFDTEARVTATQTNLNTIRTRITLFRAKEGKYPESLQELLNTYYFDAGVRKPYLSKMPRELISDKSGNESMVDTISSQEPITSDGGWVYYTDLAEIKVNINTPLDQRWAEYEGQTPNKW